MAIAKGERLLKLIAALLDTSVPMKASDIQRKVEGYPPEKESFRRAFERDKGELRALDIPLEMTAVEGVEAYRIPRDRYYLRDPGLDIDELAALNLAATAIRLRGIDPRTGLHKLGGATAGAAGAGDGAVLGPAAGAELDDNPHLVTVFDAISARRTLTFGYGAKDGQVEERTVDPHGLVHRRGHWYLRGHDRLREDERTYRLDRVAGEMQAGAPGSATVPAPADADASFTVDGWLLGDDPPVRARLVVDERQAATAIHQFRGAAVVERRQDGSVVLELDVRKVDAFRGLVLDLLADAEVLSPPALRDDLVAWIRPLAERDGRGRDDGPRAGGGIAAGTS